MIMYGFTLTCPDNNPETSVFLNPSKEKALEEAKEIISAIWHFYSIWHDYSDKTPERDYNDLTLEDCVSRLEHGKTVSIHGSSGLRDIHVKINPLEIDLGRDIINTNDYIATKLWNRQDIEMELAERGFEGTKEQIDEVVNTGYLKALGDCCDQDWSIINCAISKAVKQNPMLFNEKQDIENDEIEL